MKEFDEEDDIEQPKIPWDKRLQNHLNFLMPYALRVWEKRKNWLIANAIGAVVIILGLLLFAKPYYDVSVVILPDYGGKLGSAAAAGALSGLASSISGISLKADPNEIYQNIVMSESVLAPVIQKKYLTEKFKDSVNLIQYFEIDPDDELQSPLRERKQLLKTIDIFLKGRLKTDVDFTTKILTVTVRMRESMLAADVVNNIVESLDLYVRTQRRSNAFYQREYLEKRIKEVADSLAYFEESLRRNKEQNLSSNATPRLALEAARLSRTVDLYQSNYSMLEQQLELVKLDEIKDAPVLNVQEYVGDPIIKTGPSRLKWLVVLMVLYNIVMTGILVFSPEIQKGWAIIKDSISKEKI